MLDTYDFMLDENNGWEELQDIENIMEQDNTPYDDYFILHCKRNY